MTNHNQVRTPSGRTLLKATGVAVLVAAAILLTVVLPAEYGIDPTGVGARLGLDALADSQSPATADAVIPVAADLAPTTELDAVGQPAKPVDGTPVRKRQGDYRVDTLSMSLAPGKGAEIKAQMLTDDGMVFHWTASAAVAVDMHGERTGATDGSYTSYWIEADQTQASGSFTAPFDGTHGWYWLNRGSEPVAIEVKVAGFQKNLFFPGHP